MLKLLSPDAEKSGVGRRGICESLVSLDETDCNLFSNSDRGVDGTKLRGIFACGWDASSALDAKTFKCSDSVDVGFRTSKTVGCEYVSSTSST